MVSEKDSSHTSATTPDMISAHHLPPPPADHGTPPPRSMKEGKPSTPSELPSNTSPTSTDPLSPHLWPPSAKLPLVTLCTLITFLTGWNATALTALTSVTNPHFHISDSPFPHSVWALTAWNLGAAIAPMFVLPVMEDYGTRPGYLAVYTGFVGFVIAQPLIPGGVAGYRAFCGVRFLAGCCAGVLQTCMDGVIADLYEESVRMSRPVSCYVGALLAGVSSGPVMGGVVGWAWGRGWKWVLWVQVIIYVVLGVPVWIFLRETRVEVIRQKAERRQGKEPRYEESGEGAPMVEEGAITTQPQPTSTPSNPHSPSRLSIFLSFLISHILRPFTLLVTEPVVFVFTLLSSLSYGIVFLCTQSIPQVYSATSNFTEAQTAYIQGAVVLGELVGWAICVGGQDRFFERCAKAAEGEGGAGVKLTRKLPEKRLYAAVPASFLALAAGLFIYGFAARPSFSLYLPTFGLFLIGIGVVVVMQAIMMYVTDSYGVYAASASAAVCFGENLFAGLLPLASQGMYDQLGFGWAGGFLGFVALVLGIGPVVLVIYGERVRGRSRRMVGNGERLS